MYCFSPKSRYSWFSVVSLFGWIRLVFGIRARGAHRLGQFQHAFDLARRQHLVHHHVVHQDHGDTPDCIEREVDEDRLLLRRKRVRDHRLGRENDVLLGSIRAVLVCGQVLFTRHHLDERIAAGVVDELHHIPIDISPLVKREVNSPGGPTAWAAGRWQVMLVSDPPNSLFVSCQQMSFPSGKPHAPSSALCCDGIRALWRNTQPLESELHTWWIIRGSCSGCCRRNSPYCSRCNFGLFHRYFRVGTRLDLSDVTTHSNRRSLGTARSICPTSKSCGACTWWRNCPAPLLRRSPKTY